MNQDTNINTINYKELAQAVQEKREQAPEQRAPSSDKEVIVTILKEKTQAIQPAAVATASDQATQKTDASYLPQYGDTMRAEDKAIAQQLVELTFQKGISHGINVAAKHGPFVIDLYHDMLAETLAEELKKRNLL